MNTSLLSGLRRLICVGVVAIFTGTTSAGIILSDTFTDGNYGASLAGHTPDLANLPGGSWQYEAGDGAYEINLQGNLATMNPATARLHNTAAAAIPLASNGAYIKPTQITIAGDLAFGSAENKYSLIGFYSTPHSPSDATKTYDSRKDFTGLELDINGDVMLVENGTVITATKIAWSGDDFDPLSFTHLSYNIDTSTGAISNITVAGSSSTYSFTTSAFTDAHTQFVGLGGQGSNNGTDAGSLYVDNLVVSSVPEPASLSLLGAGTLLLFRRRRFAISV